MSQSRKYARWLVKNIVSIKQLRYSLSISIAWNSSMDTETSIIQADLQDIPAKSITCVPLHTQKLQFNKEQKKIKLTITIMLYSSSAPSCKVNGWVRKPLFNNSRRKRLQLLCSLVVVHFFVIYNNLETQRKVRLQNTPEHTQCWYLGTKWFICTLDLFLFSLL